jgi:ribosomal protein L37E
VTAPTSRKIGTTPCNACGFERADVKEGKNGTLSISCCECGTGSFVKSPKAVAALRARIGAAPAPAKASNQDTFATFMSGQGGAK